MISFFFSIGLSFFVIGFGVSLLFYFPNRRYCTRFWIVLGVGLIGSFAGGVIQYAFLSQILPLDRPYAEFVAPTAFSVVFLWIFTSAMNGKES